MPIPLIPIIAMGVNVASSILDKKMAGDAAEGKESSDFEKALDTIFDVAKPILSVVPGGQAAGLLGAGGGGANAPLDIPDIMKQAGGPLLSSI